MNFLGKKCSAIEDDLEITTQYLVQLKEDNKCKRIALEVKGKPGLMVSHRKARDGGNFKEEEVVLEFTFCRE